MTWQRIRVLVLFVVLPLILSCDSCVRQQYNVTGNLSISRTFTIDETGTFSVNDMISADEIRDALDIPQDACITAVNIRGISLTPTILEGNTATSVNVSGFSQEFGGANRFYMFEDYPLPLPVGLVQEAIVNGLLDTGISALRGRIEGFLTGLNTQSFWVGTAGDAVPAGSRINMALQLNVSGTINYTFCLEVFDFMADGPECTLPDSLPEDCPDIGSQ